MLDIDPAEIVQRGRLQPGRMFPRRHRAGSHHRRRRAQGRVRHRAAVRRVVARGARAPRRPPRAQLPHSPARFRDRQQRVFGYTTEELKILLTPMAKNAYEALGSMGTDTPIAALSDRPRMLFDYFSQLFAQVTNPPLDAIREELVTSVVVDGRARGQPARPDAGVVPSDRGAVADPVEQRAGQAALHQRRRRPSWLQAVRRRRAYPVAEGGEGLRRAIDDVRARVSEAIEDGAKLIILSDRHSNEALAPIPSLLLVSAVHHHLIREKTARRSVSSSSAVMRARCTTWRVARLRRWRDQPVPRVRDDRRHDQRGLPAGALEGSGDPQLHQGVQQGRAEGDVEDGHLTRWRRTRVRRCSSDRSRPRSRRRVLHRHVVSPRRRRPRRDRRGGGGPSLVRVPRPTRGGGASLAVAGRRVPVAARG